MSALAQSTSAAGAQSAKALTLSSAKISRKLSNEISEALDSHDFRTAANSLAQLAQLAAAAPNLTKLGSLQRWTRLAGQLDDGPDARLVLWLLLRLAACVGVGDVPTDTIDVVKHPPWEPRPLRIHDATTSPDLAREKFFVTRREKAADRQPPNRFDLSIWASRQGAVTVGSDAAAEEAAAARVRRKDHPKVPGAFVCVDVLARDECEELLQAVRSLGFERDEPLEMALRATSADPKESTFSCLMDSDSDDSDADTKTAAAVVEARQRSSGERSMNVVWVADEALNDAVFKRLGSHLPQSYEDCRDASGKAVGVGELCGLNRRWRFYEYGVGGTYRPHVDGAWPGSALDANDVYVYDAFGDRTSRLTALIYLNDDFDGGATAFYNAPDTPGISVEAVAPRQGAVLFFPHGDARGSLIHEGAAVLKGYKYVVRTEVLYKYSNDEDEDEDEAASSQGGAPSHAMRGKPQSQGGKSQGGPSGGRPPSQGGAPSQGGRPPSANARGAPSKKKQGQKTNKRQRRTCK